MFGINGPHRPTSLFVISSRCTALNELADFALVYQAAAGIFTCGTVTKPQANFHFFLH